MGNNLTIDQINAPDFSGIGQLMASAGASFNNAFDAANSVLGKYQKGQEGKADASYLNALGGIKNEQELTNFFLKNPLGQANLSPEMRKTLLEMRDTVIGYDVDRATASNTNASADSTRASTSRETVRFQDEMAKLAADRAMSPGVVDALVAGETNGQADWLAYKNQNATRNDPLAPSLVGALGFLGDMGVRMEVVSGGQESNKPGEGTGSTRHNYGNSADADFYIGDHKLDPKIPEDRAKLATIATRAAENGVTGFGEGEDYMGSGRMHIGFGSDAVWGAGGKSKNAPAWLVDAVAAGRTNRSRSDGGGPAAGGNSAVTYAAPASVIPGGAIPGPNGYTGGAQNGYLNNPDIQRGIASIRANKYLTATEAEAQIKAILDAASGGQDAINSRDAATQKLMADQAQVDALTNPSNTTVGAIQGSVINAPGLNPTTALGAAQTAGTLATGALAPVALPSGVVDPAVQLAADAAQGRNNDNLATDPANVALRTLAEVEAADDPFQKVADTYNQSRSIFSGDADLSDPRLQEAVQEMADKARVSVPEMLTTLLEISTEDKNTVGPRTGPDGYVERFINDTLNYGVNPIDIAKEKFGPGSKFKSDVATSAAASSNGRVDAVKAQIDSLAIQLQKLPAGDPKRAVITSQINSLTRELNQVGSPAQESKAKLDLLPVGTPAYQEELARFGAAIDQDTSLSASEKAALKKQWGIK